MKRGGLRWTRRAGYFNHPLFSSTVMEDNDCLQVPGYEFWIEIASKRAKQYRVERNVHGPSCYIASEVNQVRGYFYFRLAIIDAFNFVRSSPYMS